MKLPSFLLNCNLNLPPLPYHVIVFILRQTANACCYLYMRSAPWISWNTDDGPGTSGFRRAMWMWCYYWWRFVLRLALFLRHIPCMLKCLRTAAPSNKKYNERRLILVRCVILWSLENIYFLVDNVIITKSQDFFN